MTVLEKQIADYLYYCECQKKLSNKTIKAYRIDLSQFAVLTAKETIPLTKACITEYVQRLHTQYKPKSVKRKVATLKAFVNYLEFDGKIAENPLNKLRLGFKESVVLPKALSLGTIKHLLSTVHNSLRDTSSEYKRKANIRDIAVLELLFATGLRVSELCSVLSSQIDLREGHVKVVGKGARERIVFITNSEVLHALRLYKKMFLQQINSTGWFFVNRLGNKLSEQSVREMVKKYTNQAGIADHITPHIIRHSFATLMLEEDVDIRYIQSILGHSSISTTQIYTHVSMSKQRKIMARKHPRNRFLL